MADSPASQRLAVALEHAARVTGLVFMGWGLSALGTQLGVVSNTDAHRLYVTVLGLIAISGLGIVAPKVERAREWLVAALVALILGAATTSADALQHLGKPAQAHSWSVYHYYLGARYFDELGYTELYAETLKADAQGRFSAVERTRDLHTYDVVEVGDLRDQPPLATWTPERWAAFQHDVAVVGSLAPKGAWRGPLRDRGYNATPAWDAVGGGLARHLSLESDVARTLLLSLDLILLAAAFAFSVAAYGWANSLIVLLAILLWVGGEGRFGALILNYDWLAASWAAAAAMRLGRYRLCGGLIAYAAAMRVFPAVLLLGPLAMAATHLWRHRTLAPRYRDLLGAAAAVGLVLFVAGGVHTSRGFGAWGEFVGNIAHHQDHHELGERRVGLGHVFQADLIGAAAGLEPSEDHELNFEQNRNMMLLAKILGLFLVARAMIGRDDHDALLLGIPVVFIATIASRYYGTLFVLVLLLGRTGKRTRLPRDLLGDVGLFATLALAYTALAQGVESRHAYIWTNTIIAIWLSVLLIDWANRAPTPPDADVTTP